MATAGNPLTDDIETNIDSPGIDPMPEPRTNFPGERERGKREPIENPGAEEEDQEELEREDEAVDEEDPL